MSVIKNLLVMNLLVITVSGLIYKIMSHKILRILPGFGRVFYILRAPA